MKYYKSECGKLIQYNPDTDVYKIRNNVAKVDTRLSKETFDGLATTHIKKQLFCNLMNTYFRTVKHEWVYDGKKFRKLPNFEENGSSLSDNYILGKDVPYHTIEGKLWLGKVVLVYHQGKVYYHTVSYNGYAQGQLVNPNTLEIVKWCRLKNCAPIYDISAKRII